MKKNQLNKLGMYNNVAGVLTENRSLYSDIQPIVVAATAFTEKVDEIREMGSEQSIDYSGITDTKSTVKETLALHASDLAKSAASYAFDTGNKELEVYLDHSYSDLRHSRDNVTLELAMIIADEIESILGNLTDYMVTADDLAQLHTLIDQFKNLLETRGEKSSHGVAVTRKIAALFREADDLLNNKLDALIGRLRKKQPMFYETYMNARQVADLGSPRKPAEKVANQ